MTKCLTCRHCNSVRSFNTDQSLTTCACGKVQGWWSDAFNGLAVLHTPDPANRPYGRILSLHNGFLNDGPTMIPSTYPDPLTHTAMPFSQNQHNTFWRQLHDQATITPRGPETVRVWDRSARNCWAVLIEPGTTADTAWATPSEAAEHNPSPTKRLVHSQ